MKGAALPYMLGRRDLLLRALGPALVAASLAGCAVEPAEEDDGTTQSSALGDARADAILFPGDPACGGGCESSLASSALYIPPRGGKPWGDTYALGNADARSIGGYSSGRIALLRRLALSPGRARWAVMLDPSWADGTRNFAGTQTTGPAIVASWLRGDRARRFMLVYATGSAGWREYAALADERDLAGRVKICSVSVAHFEVPGEVGAGAIIDPESWDNGRCDGDATPTAPAPPPSGSCYSQTLGRSVPHGTCVDKNGGRWVCDAARPSDWPAAGADGAPTCTSCPQRPGGACE